MAVPKNESEIEVLNKFRPLVADLKLDDGTCMRYLRARGYDTAKSEESIRAAVKWKEDLAEELKVWEYPHDLMSRFKAYKTGLDKQGRLVLYVKFQEWLPARPLFDKFSPQDFLIFAFQTLSRLYKTFQAVSKEQQFIAIWDNEGVGFSDICHEIQNWTTIQCLIDVLRMVDGSFPETLYKAYFINSAWAFTWGFSFVKPFMKKYTLDKIFITGYDENKWKPALFDNVPLESIPLKYGGNATNLLNIYDLIYFTNANHPPESEAA